MRKYLIILVVSAVSLSVSAQEIEEFKPSGKVFGLLFADYHNTYSEGENLPVFQVTRSYLGYDYSFSKTVSSRVMFDGFTQVINGKMMITGYLRNAYLQYDNGKLLMRGGLIGSEQLSNAEKFFNYRYIAKPTMDYAQMVFPTDLGFMARYKAADFLTIDMSVINGKGYKEITPDTTLKVVTGATIIPVKNLSLRLYYDLMGPSGGRQSTYSIAGAYTGKILTLGAEYLSQSNHLMTTGEDYSGISIFSALLLAKKFSAFARYDNIVSEVPEGETEPWNLSNDGTRFSIGFDYSPAKSVRISPNFIGFIPEDEEAAFVGTVGINVEARF
ncbi:MAG: hypothetical protein MUC78_11560 [Bacteroidales bacterium]|jgi:hypothetical protein|nr:hypothetical protein [Bacteroidales bacterium]